MQRLGRATGLVSGLEGSCLHYLIPCCPGSFAGPGCPCCRCGAWTAGRSRPRPARAGSALTPTASCLTCGCWSAAYPATGRASSPCTSGRRPGPSIRPRFTATASTTRSWWRPGCLTRSSPGATASPSTGPERGGLTSRRAGLVRRCRRSRWRSSSRTRYRCARNGSSRTGSVSAGRRCCAGSRATFRCAVRRAAGSPSP